MKKLHWCAGIILGFSIIAALLITSFEIAMYSDFDVYQREYEKYDVLSDLDMTMDDVMYVTHEMMDYLRGEGDTLSVITTVEGREQDFFNEQDRFHMEEVRGLFIGGLNIRLGAWCYWPDLYRFSDYYTRRCKKSDSAGILDCRWELPVRPSFLIGTASVIDF